MHIYYVAIQQKFPSKIPKKNKTSFLAKTYTHILVNISLLKGLLFKDSLPFKESSQIFMLFKKSNVIRGNINKSIKK